MKTEKLILWAKEFFALMNTPKKIKIEDHSDSPIGRIYYLNKAGRIVAVAEAL